MMENHKTLKDEKLEARNLLKKIRDSLSQARKEEASVSLLTHFSEVTSDIPLILSFASIKNEIDTSLLNIFLAKTGRLLLPKVVSNRLKIYQVTDPSKELIPGPFGVLEPNPQLSRKVSPQKIGAVLVPGLGFDRKNFRIGYGKGYYDLLLASLSSIPTYGVGYLEQLVDSLPVEPTDISLKHIHLF